MTKKTKKAQKVDESLVKSGWNPGDVVRLKSGGPGMTIMSFCDSDDRHSKGNAQVARCLWYNGEGFTEGYFHVLTLQDWTGVTGT